MASVIFVKDPRTLRNALQKLPNAPRQAITVVVNKNAKPLYNAINNSTRVRTGRLKRGNIMEITPTGFHYFNNVPYAGFMNTGRYGNRYVDLPFYRFKNTIIKDVNEELINQISLIFGSIV